MKITIHRGIEQIGGCITEIESASGTKILIDLGHNLPEGDTKAEDKFDDPQQLNRLLSGVSHVFYTHYHGDHIGFEAQVPREIKQHIGELSLRMMQTLQKQLAYVKDLEEDAKTRLSALDRFEAYQSNEPKMYGDIQVTPLPVSHSAIDAHALLIECDGKTVLHTGDFRDHSYRGEEMLQGIEERLRETHVDVLIIEGTMLDRTDQRMRSESELKSQVVELLREHKYVFVLCSSMNIDSLVSFFLAAREENGRRRVIADKYQIELFSLLKKELPAPYSELFACPYGRDWEEELKRMKQNGFLMFVRESESFEKKIDEVMDKTGIGPKETLLIYSMFDGYVNKGHKAYRPKLDAFVHRYDWEVKSLHTSGHANREALERMCHLAKPRVAIIPIHKERIGSMEGLNLPHCSIVEYTKTLDDIEIVIE